MEIFLFERIPALNVGFLECIKINRYLNIFLLYTLEK